jgi:DnaJ-class molecular chaperone
MKFHGLILALFLFFSTLGIIRSKDYYSILGVSEAASDIDIRRAYRRLALEYHPDKIHLAEISSEEEKELIKQHFLDIQEAYDVIGDPDKRLAYDLKKNGQNFGFTDEFDIERYKLFPFSIFVRTKQISLAFSIKVARPEPTPIKITLQIEARYVFTGLSNSYKYLRRKICNECQGNGGLNGTCRKCSLCDGSGHTNHLFHDRRLFVAWHTKL